MRTLETAWERAKFFREWKYWTIRIAEATEKVLGENLKSIYVFGSLVAETAVASSDIDLLIVARRLPVSFIERSKTKIRILEEAGLPLVHPFEIHLVDEEEAEIYFQHTRGKSIRIR
ncbi:MAG: nucleotidyltransferase domain-containing protein [Crenarchaeota archaeon]|nr:nucleotidyltransferase domain-containing protein [Thermoproteota archaeon]